MEFSYSEHNSNRGNFEIKGISLLSKICSYFWNSRNRKYFKTAGILIGGSFIFLHETVSSQGAESDGGSFIQTPPTHSRFLEFQKSEVFQNRGNTSRGSFVTLGETVCTQKAESLSRRVTNQRDSRGYQKFQKSGLFLEPREF